MAITLNTRYGHKTPKIIRHFSFVFAAFLLLSPAAFGAVCGNNTCESGETLESCSQDCPAPPIMALWGMDLGFGYSRVGSPEWTEFVDIWRDLHQLGYTHAGVNMSYSGGGDPELDALRNLGLDIMIKISPGHHELVNGSDNAKFFNAPNFNPLQCQSLCDCLTTPNVTAYDPAYNGNLWQSELNRVGHNMNRITLMDNDVVAIDSEIWRGGRSSESCYPGALENSLAPRYTGSLDERMVQYRSHQLNRASEINSQINTANPRTIRLYYFENIPAWTQAWNDYSYWANGAGSAPSPTFYYVGTLTGCPIGPNGGRITCRTYSQLLTGFGPNAFAGSYPWVSFNYSIPHGGYTSWDPKVSQKAGYMLYQAGAAGFFEWPGPPRPDCTDCLSRLDYMRHASAFISGFQGHQDPGELVEFCDDGMDNNGDGVIDESSCRASQCGNGIREGEEDCDGADISGAQCGWFGSESGNVFCRNDCRFDTTQCTPQPPQTPAGLRLEDSTESSFRLIWNDMSENEEGFLVERRKEGENRYSVLSARIDSNQTGFTDSGLESNTHYFYRIKSFAGSRQSGYSNRTEGDTLAAREALQERSRFITCSDPANAGQRARPRICFHLESSDNVQLDVFTSQGSKVRTLLSEERTAGTHTLIWDGLNEKGEQAASGAYNVILTLRKEGTKLKSKMVLIR